MSRTRSQVIALALGVVFLGVVAGPSGGAAQRRSPQITTSQARSYFDEMERAWRELLALDVQPADANGAVARWDRAWSVRVARAGRATRDACFTSSHDCGVLERDVLMCNLVGDISAARASVFTRDDDADPHDPIAWRRAIADEAARRRAARLSCEDMPRVSRQVYQDACGRWYLHGDRALVPGTPPPVPVWESQPECPTAAMHGAEGDELP